MKDNFAIFGMYMFILLMMLLIGINCSGQTILNDKNFNESQDGLSVVEFWADWNKSNNCDWLNKIEGAKFYRIDVNSEAAKTYEIKVLPTLIVFLDGKEIERFEGNLSFKLCPKSTPKKVKKTLRKALNNDI
tara:strand:- start:1231 stop:1626 length:396 start_codon:yes stop_codon:yes gene_type:complete